MVKIREVARDVAITLLPLVQLVNGDAYAVLKTFVNLSETDMGKKALSKLSNNPAEVSPLGAQEHSDSE